MEKECFNSWDFFLCCIVFLKNSQNFGVYYKRITDHNFEDRALQILNLVAY